MKKKTPHLNEPAATCTLGGGTRLRSSTSSSSRRRLCLGETEELCGDLNTLVLGVRSFPSSVRFAFQLERVFFSELRLVSSASWLGLPSTIVFSLAGAESETSKHSVCGGMREWLIFENSLLQIISVEFQVRESDVLTGKRV